MSDKKKNEKDIFHGKTKTLKISGRTFVVKEFVLKRRIEFFDYIFDFLKEALASLPPEQAQNKNAVGYALLKQMGSEVVGLYKRVLECQEDTWLLNNITPRDELEIINALSEVNDLPLLVSQIREVVNKAKKQS